MNIRKVSIGFFLVSFTFAASAIAQETPTPAPTATIPPAGLTLTTEGVSGDIDKHFREPVLSVGSHTGTTSTTINADAYVINDEFKKYPIQFDFYVNRSLFASQIRSTELPGPVGISVPYTVAPIPFNYTVVAKVLHPNRVFTTVLNAAVERIDPTPTPGGGMVLNCTLTDSRIEGEATTYNEPEAEIAENGTQLTAKFSAVNTDDSGELIEVELSATEDASALSGTLTIDSEANEITGTYQKASGEVTSLSITTGTSGWNLDCR